MSCCLTRVEWCSLRVVRGLRRYVAVTRPIQYAKHNSSLRTYVMLALTWFISVAVSLPIAVGMNYTDRRAETPTVCTFYNAEFLIYSSMTSFYVPCVVIVLLNWRIFRAIHSRTRRRTAATTRQRLHRQLPNIYVVDNHITADNTAESLAVEMDETVTAGCTATGDALAAGDGLVTAGNMTGAGTAAAADSSGQDSSNSRGPTADMTQSDPVNYRRHQQNSSTTLQTTTTDHRRVNQLSRLTTANNDQRSRDKNASRRERKATKTLAIVLGM